MPKRESESDAEYKARKRAKKEKKRAKKEQENSSGDSGDSSEAEPKNDKVTKSVKKDKKNKKDNSKSKTPKTKPKPTATTVPEEFTSFADAPFAPSIQQALVDAGFSQPSPIQARAWPVVLAGNDLIAVAKTGSGKTLGFLLPLFHHIAATTSQNNHNNTKVPSPLCLILSPTRELAIQIHGECVKFGAYLKI